MHSPADVIAHLIVANLLGTDPEETPDGAWPVYLSDMPDSPDSVISVYDSPGRTQGRYMKTGEFVERPGVSIGVRARLYADGYAKAHALCALFASVLNTTVAVESSNYLISSIERTTTIVPLGEDETRLREEFSVNIIPVISES